MKKHILFFFISQMLFFIWSITYCDVTPENIIFYGHFEVYFYQFVIYNFMKIKIEI
jgi:hypothetical protein